MFNSSLQKVQPINFLNIFQTVSSFLLSFSKLEVENAFTSTVPTSLSIILTVAKLLYLNLLVTFRFFLKMYVLQTALLHIILLCNCLKSG